MKRIQPKKSDRVGAKNPLSADLKGRITQLIMKRLAVQECQVEVLNAYLENTSEGLVVHYSAMVAHDSSRRA